MNTPSLRGLGPLADAPFYAILDTGYIAPENWINKYDALVAGGAGLVQIRAKREPPAQRADLLQRILEHRASLPSSARHPPLIVNDDIELCLRHPGIGLHVGQDDLPAEEARQQLGPERLLGLSTHSPQQALAAIALGPSVLSYFAVGPIFATQTKPDYTPVGLELARFVANQRPNLPFYCIGGINRGNISQVRATGATRIVTVSDVLLAPDTAAAVRQSLAILQS